MGEPQGVDAPILCVTPNAAVDRTLVVENFRLNGIHRPSVELVLPGGKGCNVARAAKTLGQPAVVTGWVGGHAGDFIEDGLRAEGIRAAFVHTGVESRECISILDPATGALTEIYEKGRPVGPSEIEAFYTLYQQWLPKVGLVALSGSLPPGVPSDFYARLACLAREAGRQVALDAGGEPLRLGLEQGRPHILKCNRAELGSLAGRSFDSLDEIRQYIRSLSTRLDTTVVITLGPAGAVAASGGQSWLAQAPQIQAVSAVGSGDAFLAGLASGLLNGRLLDECLRLAVAAGSANALQIGAGRLRREDVDALAPQVWAAQEQ